MFKYSGCDHLKRVLNPSILHKELIPAAKKALRKIEYDSIAVSGVSGIVFGGALSYATQKPLIILRKLTDKTIHGARPFEGNFACKRFIIVDDIVSSGMTVEFILDGIEDMVPTARCVGIYTYNTVGWRNWRESQKCVLDKYSGMFVEPRQKAVGASPAASDCAGDTNP